ncbi:MAG: glycosyltransferase family 2 protein [Pseudonocardiaceae bacterium]
MISVEVILPCLDEVGALPGVLAAIPSGYGVLVVDNGSTDGSAEVAGAHGARVVVEPRRGYGAAVHTGLECARAHVVCVLDADGSVDPGELPRLVAELDGAGSGGAASGDGKSGGGIDLVVGRRIPAVRAAMSWHSRAGNAALACWLRRRGIPVHDLAPVRVARRSALLGLGVQDRGSGYPLETLLRAGARQWVIRELPVAYRPRAAGRSKVSGSVRGTLRAVRDMSAVLR